MQPPLGGRRDACPSARAVRQAGLSKECRGGRRRRASKRVADPLTVSSPPDLQGSLSKSKSSAAAAAAAAEAAKRKKKTLDKSKFNQMPTR